MRIAIASDHGGFELKKQLIPYMESQGISVYDMGCNDTQSVDYPDFAFPLSEAVAKSEYDFGILICGTGIGMSMCANRVPGIRCALCSEPVSAALTRQHNNANVLAMGARMIGFEMACAIVDAFLKTEFSGGRHERRVDKMTNYNMK